MINIKLFGKRFILVGNKTEGGAIATKKAYENFFPSFAHLNSNGDIYRYGIKIGTIKDIKFGKEVKE